MNKNIELDLEYRNLLYILQYLILVKDLKRWDYTICKNICYGNMIVLGDGFTYEKPHKIKMHRDGTLYILTCEYKVFVLKLKESEIIHVKDYVKNVSSHFSKSIKGHLETIDREIRLSKKMINDDNKLYEHVRDIIKKRTINKMT